TIDDPDLLMEAMETREALHEADTIEVVDALAAEARDDMKASLAGLGSLVLQDDKPAIRKTLLRLRYLDKFAQEARARRANLERSIAGGCWKSTSRAKRRCRMPARARWRSASISAPPTPSWRSHARASPLRCMTRPAARWCRPWSPIPRAAACWWATRRVW